MNRTTTGSDVQNFMFSEGTAISSFAKIRTRERDGVICLPLVDTIVPSSVDEQLANAVALRPEAIAFRGLSGVPDIERMSSLLAVQEALNNEPDGRIGILAVMGDTPQSILSLALPWPRMHRLKALIFSPLALLSKFPDAGHVDQEQWPEALRHGRAQTLLRAMALVLPAYEMIPKGGDETSAMDRAYRDGFSGIVLRCD
jgi:hypothetical protein